MSRRNRAANFSSSEKKLFVRLTDRYKHILESKVCDAETNKRKDLTWIHVAKIFNRLSTTGIVRDAKQLRHRLRNMKKKKFRRDREQLSDADEAGPDETGDEFTIEKFDESMDPLDFEQTDSTESMHRVEKFTNIKKEVPSMSSNNNNVNVLNLLEDFVTKLRKRCNRAGTSNDTIPTVSVTVSEI